MAQGGVDAAAADRALEGAVAAMGPFALAHRTRWSSRDGELLVACAAHRPEQLGGVEYLYGDDDRVALFAGRPIVWTGDGQADGRRCLDPRAFLTPAAEWSGALDGRCAVARYDTTERALEVYADPVGLYSVFTAVDGGTRWVSNSVEVLRQAVGAARMRPSVLASFFGAAYSMTGEPLWEGVDRLARGKLCRFRADGSQETADLLSTRDLIGMFGAGFDADAAAATLAAFVGASGRWPGRPDVVPTTAGKDSRLIYEAALWQGLDFQSETVVYPEDDGYPLSEDAQAGRELCRRAGVPHRAPQLDIASATLATLPGGPALLRHLSTGAVAFNDVRTVELSLVGQPVRIMHKGLGGEIARNYFGVGRSGDAAGLGRQLTDRMLHAWPRPLLSPEGRALLEADVRTWAEARLGEGAEPADVPDLFYVDSRVGGWAGDSLAVHEVVEDTALPLCSRRLLPHMLGMPVEDRVRQRFHADVLAALQRARGVEVAPAPDGAGPGRRSVVQQRVDKARGLGRKAAKELSARAPWSPRLRNAAEDTFIPLFHQTRVAVASQPQHEAWAVLDRGRVRALLARDPRRMEPRSRLQVARLATAFAPD
jgi:hypothetical protein